PDAAIRAPRPFAFGPVAIQLNAVAVGIAQVHRLADAVIGRAFERDAVFQHATNCSSEGLAVRKQNREMIEPGRARRRPRCSTARSEEHTSELQSRSDLVCRLLLE